MLRNFLIFLFSVFAFIANAENNHLYIPDSYSWTTQSKNSSESMPCGGGSIGLNVWVENGDILFYVQRSGAFDENNTMLKAGRFRLQFFDENGKIEGQRVFKQTLNLYSSEMKINMDDINTVISVDVFNPLIQVKFYSPKPVKAVISYESWRYKDRLIRKMEFQQCSYKFGKVPNLMTKADSIVPDKHSILFYNQNPDSTVFDATAWEQGLQDYRKEMFNPIGNLISGGKMVCPDFRLTAKHNAIYASTDYVSWQFETQKAIKRTAIYIALGDTQDGLDAFNSQINETLRHNKKADYQHSITWWHSFWQRSYIKTESKDNAKLAQMVRNYTLFRYMLGCNAFGKWPTKFNGGLFTFDPVYVDPKYPFTPDFRRWGGGTFTAQNQRLVYWPMIKSGDYDMLRSQLDFYARLLPTGMLRSKVYWGHGGAYFNEQIENFGLPNIDEYGKKRPSGFDPGVEYNAWLEYTWDTALEFCGIALAASNAGATISELSPKAGTAISGSSKAMSFDVSPYIPLIKQCLRFFDEHYQWQAKRLGRKALDGDGHLIIYPGSGCETFKMAYNPASTIAGLAFVSKALCDYLIRTNSDSDTIAVYKAIEKRIPEIPTRYINGHKTIAPAVTWARINNRELPQLYPVFPWHLYGVGHDSLQTAINTWLYDPYVKQFKGVTSWEQANIFAADLGLTDEAAELNYEKLKDGPYRFPAFWGPGHDWAPDHNWGGSGMIGLQEMLLQFDKSNKPIIKPAWPNDWLVKFKLE